MDAGPATLEGLLAGGLLLGLATAHAIFWRLRLAVRGAEDELVAATTADGWTLALARHRPRGAPRRPPVLLVHGLAMNRQVLDLGLPGRSLAHHLAGEGFDAFALDLRGHGGSRRGPGRGWTLDHYLDLDVPAALDAVRAATGEPRVLWVGHSQGALLGLVAAARFPERIAGVVALAPPWRLDPRLARSGSMRLLIAARLARPLARAVAPLAGLWQPRAADLAIRRAEMERPIFRRVLMNAFERPPPGVVVHFGDLARSGRLGPAAGGDGWRELVAGCRQPALFVAAPEDGLAPPAAVREAAAGWGGEATYLEAEAGVGHTDLVLGRRAVGWLFPRVTDWLAEVASSRR